MNLARMLFVVALFVAPPIAAEESEALLIAKRVVSGGEHMDVEANADKITTLIISNNPGLAPDAERIKGLLIEHFQSDELITAMAEVYVANFSLDEIKELERLMENPVMIKWLQRMPEIMPQLVALQREAITRVFAEFDQQ